MAKYRKKPVVIEASQWFEHGNHPEVYSLPENLDVEDWLETLVVEGKTEPSREDLGYIMTLEAGHVVSPGDWIICGLGGEFYPCKPNIFEKTYEKVEDK